ncbi:10408_t:CDS:1 [Ambispora leptoticha]|uniref:10408_t:CDS:1 n=1 Tax=Ambispora leptoticha TaxID=144679 RepID=A0A9N9ERQ8_9GLOM|nr:10408_t:CDS:1 [Ambispora leptoticha]
MKNLTLILVFTIVTFSIFTFAIALPKWKRETILRRAAAVDRTIIKRSSLLDRDRDCPTGYFSCPNNDGCCPVDETCLPGGPPYRCSGSCTADDTLCGDGTCCDKDRTCASDGYCAPR